MSVGSTRGGIERQSREPSINDPQVLVLGARKPGGGRKRLADLDPGQRPALLALVEPDDRGDPMSPLRWTTKSLRALSGELTRQGHRAGAGTVADLLRKEGFSLQGNARTIEGSQVPDRDAHFGYLNERVREHRDAGEPVISVDTKGQREAEMHIARGGPATRRRAGGRPQAMTLAEKPWSPSCGSAWQYRGPSWPTCSASPPAPSP